MDEDQGSSRAAQGARQDSDTPGERPGLISRLWAAFFPTTNQEPEVQGPSMAQSLGLGNLRLKRVEDVMVPRVEITSVPVEISRDELVSVFRDSGYSRLPLFEDSLDTPVGMVHLKDLALRHGFNGKSPDFDLRTMSRPVLFVPPSMPIGVLLAKMQAQRTHMALVIDEYGGVDGLATIEDLIEQVIGEIEDEHDVEEADLWREEKPGSYIVRARAPLDEFEAETGCRLSDDEMDEEIGTLGGLVFMLSGRVPVRGEVIKHPSGAEITIVDADPRRIKRLRVVLPQQNAA